MGKRDRKKARHGEPAGPKEGPKAQPKAEAPQHSSGSGSEAGRGRLAVWFVAVVVVMAVAAVAWIATQDGTTPVVATTEAPEVADVRPSPTADATAEGAVPDTGKSGARLEIPEPEFDFGFIPQSAKVSHVFWLYAAGEDTLRILKVNPG